MDNEKTIEKSIFVLIASYRDSECRVTIKDLYRQAKYPEKIYVGICWQFDPEDPFDCIYQKQIYQEHIRIDRIHHLDTQGVCWARHRAQKLFQDEEYILVIDSHMLFEPDWDEYLISELKKCPAKKSIISSYPPGFKQPADKNFPAPIVNSARWHKLKYPPPSDQYPDGNLRGSNYLLNKQEHYKHPIRCAFFAAGFTFMPAQSLKEVPFDPHIDWDEEEMSFSVRLWTHGWNLYAVKKHVIHHLYARKRTSNGTHNHKKLTDESELKRRFIKSKKRFFHLLGKVKCDEPEVLIDLNLYGLGATRSLRCFEAFSGIYLTSQKISIRAIRTWFALNSEAHKLNGDEKDLLAHYIRKKTLKLGVHTIEPDSTIESTKRLQYKLPELLQKYAIQTMMDLPCGNSNWIFYTDLALNHYVGADFLTEVIEFRKSQSPPNFPVSFKQKDIRLSILERFDLIFVRDCFTHFNYEDVEEALMQIKRSGSKYLLVSHYMIPKNNGMKTIRGNWEPINLQLQPYCFPEPLDIIDDDPGKNKYMALWSIDTLPDFKATPSLRIDHYQTKHDIYDKVLNFDELEYFYSLRYFDCHLEQQYNSIVSIDHERMSISSVYHSIIGRICQLFCLDSKQIAIKLYYQKTTVANIAINTEKPVLLMPMVYPEAPIHISISSEKQISTLKSGSIIKLNAERILLNNIDIELEIDFDEKLSFEWAVCIIIL